MVKHDSECREAAKGIKLLKTLCRLDNLVMGYSHSMVPGGFEVMS